MDLVLDYVSFPSSCDFPAGLDVGGRELAAFCTFYVGDKSSHRVREAGEGRGDEMGVVRAGVVYVDAPRPPTSTSTLPRPSASPPRSAGETKVCRC